MKAILMGLLFAGLPAIVIGGLFALLPEKGAGIGGLIVGLGAFGFGLDMCFNPTHPESGHE